MEVGICVIEESVMLKTFIRLYRLKTFSVCVWSLNFPQTPSAFAKSESLCFKRQQQVVQFNECRFYYKTCSRRICVETLQGSTATEGDEV